jgi:TolA-binding protein
MVVSTHLTQRVGSIWRGAHLLLLGLLLNVAPGCQATTAFWESKHWPWDKEAKTEYPVSADSIVLAGGQIITDKPLPVLGGDYDAAFRLYQDKEYAKAEPIFESIAENTKNTLQMMELARYYQCECLYHRRKYPGAADHYMQLLNNFPSAQKGPDVRKRLYDIANYWLDETRDAMEAHREVEEGKRWFVMPSLPLHFDETKPLFDIEGRALKALESVYMTDPKGELGEKALFMLGTVKFYHGSYRDADHYFYQLVQTRPNGKFAPKALELSIICKHICQGGPNYDGRRLQEARDLIKTARMSYPELAKGSDKFLTKEEFEIHQLEAERDYNLAKLWDRTGHPGSAYFYYEIVRRRYPGSEFADKSAKRMLELKVRAEHEQNKDGPAQADERTAPASQPSPPPPGLEPGPAPRILPPSVTGPAPK